MATVKRGSEVPPGRASRLNSSRSLGRWEEHLRGSKVRSKATELFVHVRCSSFRPRARPALLKRPAQRPRPPPGCAAAGIPIVLLDAAFQVQQRLKLPGPMKTKWRQMRTAGRNHGKLSIKARLQIIDARRLVTLEANYSRNHASARPFSTAALVNMQRFINNSS